MARRLAPKSISRIRFSRTWSRFRQEYGRLSVAEAFRQTYRNGLWGSLEGEKYFSGGGSLEQFSAPYAEWLLGFIDERKISSVIDLGCGDFRVGRRICEAAPINYVGVDVVPELISYNRSRFGNERIRFECANIIDDRLPDGDLCLIRQVFQHLSNEQISRVLANCAKFPFLAVTEDVYRGSGMRPNLDVKHGPDNRWFKRSGVFLELPPFAVPVQVVLEIPHESNCLMRTCLIEREHKPSAMRVQ
jgi:SAM-dependent methyltransferase